MVACDVVSFGIVKQSLCYCSTKQSQHIESCRTLSCDCLVGIWILFIFSHCCCFTKISIKKIKLDNIVEMTWISWMQRCIGFLAIIFICISKLEAASVQRSHSINEDSVRKCGYDVSVLLTKFTWTKKNVSFIFCWYFKITKKCRAENRMTFR